MNPVQTTPVPNALFDSWLGELKASELKILLIIIRQTLGWKDLTGSGGRKSRDWISTSQLERKTGASRRAISTGLARLVHHGLIRITDARGFELNQAINRKGKIKLFYELSIWSNNSGDNSGESCLKPLKTCSTNAEIAENLSKNVQGLAQKLLITKQNPQN